MVRIIADSTCDIELDQQQKLNIDIIPMHLFFEGEEFIDGVTITTKQFYEKLETTPELPKTTQITPAVFSEIFKKYIDNGDEIVCLTLSSELSGTYQSAKIAQKEISPNKIFVIDSRTVTFGFGLIVHEAIKLRDKGLSAKEIFDEIEVLKDKQILYGIVDTLKYLSMGGRLSRTSAVIGTVLKIKPVVFIGEGKIVSIGKERGYSKSKDFVLKKISENKIDTSRLVIFGASKDMTLRENFMKETLPILKVENYIEMKLGAAVGTHAGPNCVGIAYFKK